MTDQIMNSNAEQLDLETIALSKFKRRSERLVTEFALKAPQLIKQTELNLLKESLEELQALINDNNIV